MANEAQTPETVTPETAMADSALDMKKLLDQPANVVGLGSRTGDAIARRTTNLKKWKGMKTMALNPTHKNPGDDGWTVADSLQRLIQHCDTTTEGGDPYRQNAEHDWDGDLFGQDLKAVVATFERIGEIVQTQLADAMVGRDKSRAEAVQLRTAFEQCEVDPEYVVGLERDRDRLQQTIGQANAALRILDTDNVLPDIGDPVATLALTAIGIAEERDKLAAFKTFVHDRLDTAGVPTHPDGPHSKEGCRIGDRLDLVFWERDRLRDELAVTKAQLEMDIERGDEFDQQPKAA